MKKIFEGMSDTEKNILEIAIALIVLIAFIGWRLYSNYQSAQNEVEESQERTLVKDNNRYFTALGCAQKYINTVKDGNKDNILLILNEEYKNKYHVNANNINNYIPNLEGDYEWGYVGEEMYSKKISKNVTEYYINGQISKTIMDEETTYIDYDMTIILYENEMLFSVRPGVE